MARGSHSRRFRAVAFFGGLVLAIAPLAAAAGGHYDSTRERPGCHSTTAIIDANGTQEAVKPPAAGHKGCHGSPAEASPPPADAAADQAAIQAAVQAPVQASSHLPAHKEKASKRAGAHRCNCNSVPTLAARPCGCGASANVLVTWPDLEEPIAPRELPVPALSRWTPSKFPRRIDHWSRPFLEPPQ
ncbi:MAG: hypothetical protein ACI8TX_002713 [Hyphomicrobiaceae bacterium]|jgi:hypothetical protein